MFTLYAAVTILTAAANLYAASNEFRKVDFVLASMDRLGIPRSQLLTLGALKAAGAIGLLMGFAFPSVGIAAAAGLVLFFLGAVVWTTCVQWYSHLPFPSVWLLFAIAALVLRVDLR